MNNMKLELELEIRSWDDDSVEGTWHGNDDGSRLDAVAVKAIENWITLLFENALDEGDSSHPWVAAIRALHGNGANKVSADELIGFHSKDIAVELFAESGDALGDETSSGLFVGYRYGVPR